MQKEILQVTSLRFLAALHVFLFHLQIYWHISKIPGLGRFLTEGACSMGLFFILSGFVLGYRFHQGVHNYKSYAFSRFTRIYPVYFLAALVTIPWLIISLAPYGSNLIVLRYFFVVFANIFMIQAWMPQLFTLWNGGSWSISVEMFFYALFPFLVNQLKQLSNKQLAIALPVLYLTASMPGLSWVLFTNNANNIIFYAIPIFRVSEFIIGLICGLLFARGVRMPRPNLACFLFFMTGFCYLSLGPAFGFSFVTNNFMMVPIYAFLIISAASLSSGFFYELLTKKTLVYLGRISYSFYSFQALVLMTLLTNYNSIVAKFPSMASAYVLGIVSFVVLLAIASISYYFVENKFRNYLMNRFNARSRGFQESPAVALTTG